MDESIELREFRIKKELYGANEGQYVVTARFKCGQNDLTLNIDKSVADKVIDECRESIANASASAIELIINATKLKSGNSDKKD